MLFRNLILFRFYFIKHLFVLVLFVFNIVSFYLLFLFLLFCYHHHYCYYCYCCFYLLLPFILFCISFIAFSLAPLSKPEAHVIRAQTLAQVLGPIFKTSNRPVHQGPTSNTTGLPSPRAPGRLAFPLFAPSHVISGFHAHWNNPNSSGMLHMLERPPEDQLALQPLPSALQPANSRQSKLKDYTTSSATPMACS